MGQSCEHGGRLLRRFALNVYLSREPIASYMFFLHYFLSKDSKEFPYISYVTRRVHNVKIFNSQTLCNGYSILLMWTRWLSRNEAKSTRESCRLRVLVFHNTDKDITLPRVLYEREFASRLILSKIHPLPQETSIYAYIHMYFQVKNILYSIDAGTLFLTMRRGRNFSLSPKCCEEPCNLSFHHNLFPCPVLTTVARALSFAPRLPRVSLLN